MKMLATKEYLRGKSRVAPGATSKAMLRSRVPTDSRR
jgi:hypothetical protein